LTKKHRQGAGWCHGDAISFRDLMVSHHCRIAA
jgi:hypothetical protein